jgi:hypothetical protein
MLEMFRNAITDEEMFQLCRVLFEKASKGDMAALKMVWQYKLGKPLPAPNPDMIERDEWNNYQTDAMTLDEMKQVLGRLGKQLLRSMPGMRKELEESREEKKEETAVNDTVSNGDSKPQKDENATVSNGDIGPEDGEASTSSRATRQASRATPAPSTRHAPPTTSSKKSVRKQWIEPIARKVKGRKALSR